MSLNILLVGDSEQHHPLVQALEMGLHEVNILSVSEALSMKKVSAYSAVVLCLDDEITPKTAKFVQKLKQQPDLSHIPLIACFGRNTVQVSEEIRNLPFDDLLCPQHDNEYSSIAPKITTIYRRLQVLDTMRTRSELLEIEHDHASSGCVDIALLLGAENTARVQEFPITGDYTLHFFDSVAGITQHIAHHLQDILIIDAGLGLEAMKLASRLSSNFGKHSPVLVLIPPDHPQYLMQCVEIRVHDFVVLPIVPALFDLKIAAMQRWVQQYDRYNSSVEQQLSLSVRDELTGLYNRRYINRLLSRLAEQAGNQSRSFSVCMMDVDHFKNFNDTYGHHAGDSILSQLAYQMELRVRRHDNVGRWGGEEFIVVFADVTENLGVILAERIRGYIAENRFTDPALTEDLRITISIGVAHYRIGESPESLIDRADKALYQAKLAGRNCVIAA